MFNILLTYQNTVSNQYCSWQQEYRDQGYNYIQKFYTTVLDFKLKQACTNRSQKIAVCNKQKKNEFKRRL